MKLLVTGGKGIGIGGEVDEFPIVFRLLVLNAILDIPCGELFARVLHAVRDDHAQDIGRTLFFRHVRELLSDGIHSDADSIVQGSAAGAVVLRHEVVIELSEVSRLDEADNLIVELEEIKHGFAGLFALLLQELVEAAFDVVFYARHGAGCVQDDDDVRVVLFHVLFLLVWIVEGVCGTTLCAP